VGYMSAAVGREVLALIDSFHEAHPSGRIAITETSLTDMFGPLRCGAVDVSVLPLPVREVDLVVQTVIFTEPAMVALPHTHRWAQRRALSTHELNGETALEVANLPEYWRAHWSIGRPTPPSSAPIFGFQELLALVEAERGIAVVGAQCQTYYPRPGLNYIPLADGPSFAYAIVVRADETRQIVADFVRASADWSA
jgi:hypothetical protein